MLNRLFFWLIHQLTRKDKCLLLFQAACGGVLFNILILYGMKTTTAAAAGIITSVTPIMIFILAALLLRETITCQKLFAVLIASVGLIVLSSGKIGSASSQSTLLGNLLVLLAVIPESLFTILSKYVGKHIKEIEAVVIVNAFNALVSMPFACWYGFHINISIIPYSTWLQLVVYGISGGVLFFLLWYRGLSKVDANIAALFTGVMPVSTAVLAFLLLHEPLTRNEWAGMILVLVAILVGCKTHMATENQKKHSA